MQQSDITYARVFRIAAPIILSNATVPLLGLVDTFALGQLGGEAPIGAVAIGAAILSIFYWLFGFLRMGTTGMVAQARGAEDFTEVSALLIRGLGIAAIAGFVLILLQKPVLHFGVDFMGGSQDVRELALLYLSIRIWTAPITIADYALTGWLIAMERTRSVFALQLIKNGLNVVLSLLFVLQFGWGVAGVAYATILAELVGFAFGLYQCRSAFIRKDWRNRAVILQADRIKRMIAVNGDIMIRSVLLQLVFVEIVRSGARFGDTTLAANSILLVCFEVSAFALDGFAFAAEALVGNALGARKRAALRRAVWISSLMGLATSIPMSLILFFGGPYYIDIMTPEPDIRMVANQVLWICALAPLCGLPAFMLDGIFIGATRTKEMRNMMIVSIILTGLFYWPATQAFGNAGLWASLIFFLVIRAVTLGWLYPRLEAAAEH